MITHLVLRDGLPIVGWVEHLPPRTYGLAAWDWEEVVVGAGGKPERVDDASWREADEPDAPDEAFVVDEFGAYDAHDGSDGSGASDPDRWSDDRWSGDRWSDDRVSEAHRSGRLWPPQTPPTPQPSADERRWAELVEEVGSAAALRALDAAPLPVEEVDLDLVPATLVGVVAQVCLLLDEAFERWPGAEARTACHRFLALAVDTAPARLGAHDAERTAAAVFWAVGRANHLIGPRHLVTNGEVLAHFGQMREAVVDHALQLIEPADHVRWGSTGYGRMGRGGTGLRLGRPELLVSARRKVIVADRDRLVRRGVADGAAGDAGTAWERRLRLLSDSELT